jgi:hypothetical protein
MKSWRWRHDRGEQFIATGDLLAAKRLNTLLDPAIGQVRLSSR